MVYKLLIYFLNLILISLWVGRKIDWSFYGFLKQQIFCFNLKWKRILVLMVVWVSFLLLQVIKASLSLFFPVHITTLFNYFVFKSFLCWPAEWCKSMQCMVLGAFHLTGNDDNSNLHEHKLSLITTCYGMGSINLSFMHLFSFCFSSLLHLWCLAMKQWSCTRITKRGWVQETQNSYARLQLNGPRCTLCSVHSVES